jgi:hypothetical protein
MNSKAAAERSTVYVSGKNNINKILPIPETMQLVLSQRKKEEKMTIVVSELYFLKTLSSCPFDRLIELKDLIDVQHL